MLLIRFCRLYNLRVGPPKIAVVIRLVPVCKKLHIRHTDGYPFRLSCGLINFQFDKTKLPLMRERMLVCIIGWFPFSENYLSFFLSRIAIASFDIGTRIIRFIIVIRPIPTSPRSQTTVYSCKPPIKSITSAIIL